MRSPLVVVCCGCALVLAVLFASEPLLGDSWGNAFLARWDLTVGGLYDHARYNYEFGNPRWAQLVLVASFHSRVFPLLIAPLVAIALVLVLLVLVRGRAPRRDADDAWLFGFLLAALLVTTPAIGSLWFYRPTFTNYVLPLLLQLGFLVPYRLHQAGALRRPSLVAILIVPLGLLAGAGTEHMGAGIGVAAIALTIAAYRRERRVPAWAVLGVIALGVGYAVLLTAPGQMARYQGLATKSTLVDTLLDRGVVKTLWFASKLLLPALPITGVLVVAALLGRQRLSRATLLLVLGALATAAIIFGTTLASPKLPPRMLSGPAALIVVAMGLAYAELAATRARRWLHVAATVIAGGMLAALLVVHVVTGREGRARERMIRRAAVGSEVSAPPYTFAAPSFLTFGDDFRSSELRKTIADQFGIAVIRWE